MEVPAKLLQLKRQFTELPEALPGIMKDTFNDVRSVVEDMNTEQLDRGERADYSSLPNYSITSVRKFGKPEGPMTLHDTGAFWGGIELVVTDDGVELVGRDIKTEMLQLRYDGIGNSKIIGLQEDNKLSLESDYLKPEMEPKMKNFLEQ